MATRMKLGVSYKLDLSHHMQFGPIPKQSLWKAFTDGRVAGVLNELLCVELFNNLSHAPASGAMYDLIDSDGNWYEARAVTKWGVKLIPSSMWGASRTLDKKAYRKRLKQLHGFVFTDVRNSPQFTITFVPVSKIPASARDMSAKQFDDWTSSLSLISKKLSIR